MKVLFSASVATVALVAAAQAQQSKVTVDGKDYTVNELPGRTMHMVQLSDPQSGLSAMISVNNQGGIVMYASPAGGGTPDQKALIDKVWAAYQDQKNGTAAAHNPPAATPANDAGDPNAALRQQQAALAVQAQQRAGDLANRNANASKPPLFKQFTADGAIVTDPQLGDVTVSDNGMRYEWSVSTAGGGPLSSGVPLRYVAYFEGGDKEAGAGAKTGKLLKGLGTGIITSEGPGSTTITSNTDAWKVEMYEGKRKSNIYESSGIRTGGSIGYNGRDPAGHMGEGNLYRVSLIEKVVEDEVTKAKAGGQTVAFDPATDRFQRGKASLEKAVKELQPR